ncbi:uncharacterized protein BO95DRAFT_220358 [Aspergillus brunneoviolaceus CBS 621.78]|uniref:Uncharacterized protein n=1 Tax=Aspergillus brunneoviolaceus CBS 621.78 TaxID=1450534 RepID=A0ACD1GLB2_9EURO|nr:hypothetical protein BO95DRAFT_220358 [Aspergillus brunneoviolaceus CBS 621.78]RAH50037.1 hypothetical protein BO95DRAFT_220358 [Aspergillus brunneoviolaceus CBS 621.78]
MNAKYGISTQGFNIVDQTVHPTNPNACILRASNQNPEQNHGISIINDAGREPHACSISLS